MTTRTVFRDVRVFDGTAVLPDDTVIVHDGVIMAVGAGLSIPPGATVIDGRNRSSLLPGLIDAHTHVLGQALRQALRFGVTTELDMANDPVLIHDAKARQHGAEGPGLADLRSAGSAATVPGGHGTDFMPGAPTLTEPREAPAFVAARIAEGSDYLKIHYEDGQLRSRMTGKPPVPVLSLPIMRALVVAAHERGLQVLVHVGTLAAARDAIEAGVDGLAHVFVDSTPDPGFGRFAAERGVYAVPTLVMIEQLTDPAALAELADDPALSPYLASEDLALLARYRSGGAPAPLADMTVPNAAVRALAAHGVPILAGSDSVFALHGVALHRELHLLCLAGLSPAEALSAATAAPAAAFGLADRGRIAPGLRADLLLVDGDPCADIGDLRRIAGIWKCGVAVDRSPAFAPANH